MSDNEWCDDVDEAVSDCGSDASGEDWQPDAEDEDSDDEKTQNTYRIQVVTGSKKTRNQPTRANQLFSTAV